MYNFIKKWSNFVLNETLKTNDIDITIRNIENELSLLSFNFSISKVNNVIELTLNEFYSIQNFDIVFNYLDSLFIDRNGWFPSKYKIINLSDNKNIFQYNEDYLKDNQKYFKTVIITYEPKYDVEINVPDKLYHLTIQQYENKILKNGLIPKTKNKLSKHLDRIYVCGSPNGCYNLIQMMKISYINSKTPNTKWVIFEINLTDLDIKLYKDPNYNNGYYITDNIHPDRISIFDKE